MYPLCKFPDLSEKRKIKAEDIMHGLFPEVLSEDQ